MTATADGLLGVRLPDAVLGAGGEAGWRHWKHGNCLRGAYMKVLNFDGDIVYWKARTPAGDLVAIAADDVTEFSERTITVLGEIETAEWRGRLRDGRWQEA